MGILEEFDNEGSESVTDLHHMTEALRVSPVWMQLIISLHTGQGRSWAIQTLFMVWKKPRRGGYPKSIARSGQH